MGRNAVLSETSDSFLAQTKGRREREREKKGKGKEEKRTGERERRNFIRPASTSQHRHHPMPTAD